MGGAAPSHVGWEGTPGLLTQLQARSRRWASRTSTLCVGWVSLHGYSSIHWASHRLQREGRDVNSLGSVLQQTASPDSDTVQHESQDGGRGALQQLPEWGFVSLHGSKDRIGETLTTARRGTAWDPAPHTACDAAAAGVHGEVGVLGLGMALCEFPLQWLNLQGGLGRSKQLQGLPLNPLAHPPETGEWLPESPSSFCSISPSP